VRILDGFMAAAVLHNIVASFTNAGILPLPDEDLVRRCRITPDAVRSFWGISVADSLASVMLAAIGREFP
jgi:hypothetical protein